VKTPFSKVCVIGLGYIGLPTAATLASRGVEVTGVDVNPKAVEAINQGKIHIVEPELDAIVHRVVTEKKLKAVPKPEAAEAFIIAVPTPFKGEHEPDLSFIEAAAKSIAPVLQKGNLVILESTSPVGTTEKLSHWLADIRKDLSFPHQKGENSDVRVAYCPERVLPGHVIRELVQNDRIIGGLSAPCSERAKALYKLFVEGECVITNAKTAEMAKLTENASRDVNIAFANELSLICDKLGIDVWELISLANRHPRVKILQPGPGVGGHCIAVDPWFIVDSAPLEAQLIRKAREVNDGKPHWVVSKIKQAASGRSKPVIACLGLAFKADIDDLRESPAVDIVRHLLKEQVGEILVVEPYVEKLPSSLKGQKGLKLVEVEEALSKAQIIVLLVNHKSFYDLDRKRLEGKVVIDTRGVWR
jgi:UDP-N-acetyl-D-mannosaminuronic acid dehydrogenase